jgi:hypothetical protein
MTAEQIIELLAAKHADDVFVPECKDGSTWGGHLRMDAWAMAKSWSHPLVSAYEVKVARGDWLKDQKFQHYLAYCNVFHLVCPRDVIRPEEVPAEAGLLYVSSTGNRLVTKKKAPYRQVTVPEDLYRYVLMSRVRITANWHDRGEDVRQSRIAHWKSVLAERAEAERLGYAIKGRIAEVMKQLWAENHQLKAQMESLQAFKDELRAAGVDPGSIGHYRWTRERARQQIVGGLDQTLVPQLRELMATAERTLEAIGPKKEQVTA